MTEKSQEAAIVAETPVTNESKNETGDKKNKKKVAQKITTQNSKKTVSKSKAKESKPNEVTSNETTDAINTPTPVSTPQSEELPKGEVAPDNTSVEPQISEELPKEESTINNTNTPEVSEELPKESKEPNESELIELIYGNEPQKELKPFPNSEIQTQTKKILNDFNIDGSRLPQNILNAVNDLIGDFTYFAETRNMGMIGGIMDKDLTALNLLKAWIEPRKEYLTQLMPKDISQPAVITVSNNPQQQVSQQPSGISVTKVPIVNDNNMPIAEKSPLLAPPVHTNSNFQPRELQDNSFKPSVQDPAVAALGGAIPAMGINENKNAHYEMLTQANPEILRKLHEQQNPYQQQIQQQPVAVDPEKEILDYTTGIMNIIKSTFQFNHWGYIPLDVLQSILQTCRKDYSYEIVNAGDKIYINVSNGTNTIQTDKFCLK